jgi:hypothetical protein
MNQNIKAQAADAAFLKTTIPLKPHKSSIPQVSDLGLFFKIEIMHLQIKSQIYNPRKISTKKS